PPYTTRFRSIQQCTSYPTGDIEERQVAYLTCGLAQARGHLLTDKVQHARILLGDFPKLGVADFRHLALGLGFDPGTAGIHVIEQRSEERRVGKEGRRRS